MSPPWKKWKEEVWFGPKEVEADEVVAQPTTPSKPPKPKKEKKEKPKKEERRVSIDDNDEADDSIKPRCKDYLLLDTRLRVLYVVLVCLFIGVICPALISYYLSDYRADLGNCETPAKYRIECLSGAGNVTEESCQAAGCCFNPTTSPKCFHSNPTRYTYGAQEVAREGHLITVDLKPEMRDTDPFGRPLSQEVECTVRAVNRHHLIIQIKEKTSQDSYRLMSPDEETALSETDFEVTVETGHRRSFGVAIKRSSTGTTLVDSTYGPIVISPDYVEMTVSVPSTTIFGLGSAGDRRTAFARSFASYTKLAVHNRPGAEGFHPFFIGADPANSMFHGVYWDNPYPLEVQLSPAPAVTFRAMGGNAVIHLLSGPTPGDVSYQLMRDLVGPVAMLPFWSLGFHLCRETNDQSVFDRTVDEMDVSDIPFDSDCIDLRLSGPGANAIDDKKFPRVYDQREKLRDRKKKFILAQPPHLTELTNGSWITLSENSSSALPVKRFSATVYLPSFSGGRGPFVDPSWDRVLQPDGIHLIDNRPLDESTRTCDNITGVFVPEKLKTSLAQSTVCPTAYHPSVEKGHLEVHNEYGIQHLTSWIFETYGYFRMFFSNRASAWGNEGWAAHPGEDFTANWVSMHSSLIQVLEMGLYGVLQAGAPICGSTNSSLDDNVLIVDQEQLCTRWYQMGLLLPYAHSMSKLNHALRTPVDWSLNFRRVIAGYIRLRYSLLPYYYTLFYEAKIKGTPMVRPVWYNFHQDVKTYNISDQFMIGDAIMVCPALVQSDQQNSVTVSAYFPNGTWFDYHTREWLLNSTGERHNLVTGMSHINMFIVNGTVFVTQEPGSSAEDTRRYNYTVTVGAPFKTARGKLYVDDGIHPDEAMFDLIHFTFDETSFKMELVNNTFKGREDISTTVDRVRILGLALTKNQIPSNAKYDNSTKVLEFENLDFNWTKNNNYYLQYISY